MCFVLNLKRMFICVLFDHLQIYIEISSLLRGSCEQVIISYTKPYHAVSRDIISGQRKAVIDSGIHIVTFTTHNTRSASTSKGLPDEIPIENAGNIVVMTFAMIYN